MARLLITNTTRPKGGIFLLDTGSGELRQLYDQPTHGLTRAPDGFYCIENFGSIHHLDPKSWKVTKRAETGFEGCHDLRWIDGSFYMVASQGNWVARLDPELRILDRMQIVASDDDVCHANCLIARDGELLLSIFTLSPGRREEKRFTRPWKTEGKILRLDWERKRFDVYYEPLNQPHSLIWHDERLYFCESFTSDVSRLSPDRKRKERLCRLRGFVRGLAFAEGNAYVGISRWLRHMSPWQRYLARRGLPCGVVELDTKRWKPRRQFPIPGQQVYELLVLEEDLEAGQAPGDG